MKVLILLNLFALVSCAPRAIVVEPLAPAVVKASGDVKAAAVGAKRVQAAVVTTHAQAKGIAATADNLVAETARLRNLPGIPLDEFDALWKMTTDLQRETFAHEIQTQATVIAADDGAQLATTAATTTAALEPLAKATDTAVADLKTQIVEQADNAALGRSLKWLVGIGAVLIGIIAIGYVILKFKPPFI